MKKRWLRQCRYCAHYQVRKGCFNSEMIRSVCAGLGGRWIAPTSYWVWTHADCPHFELSEDAKISLDIIAQEAKEKGIPLIEKLKETGLIAEPELLEQFGKEGVQ